MAKKKISELPVANPMHGGELFPLVQDGTTKQAVASNLVGYVADLVGPEIIVDHLLDPNPHPVYALTVDVPAMAPVQSVAGKTGAVTLTIGDTTGLQTALDGKEPTFAKGSLIQGSGVTLTGTLTDRLVGAGNITISASGGGSGTVTSVAVADATGITWTGSPITTSGTLTPTLSANLQAWHALATSAKEDAFSKGTLAAGSGVKLTGTLSNRLVGTGTVTVEGTGAAIVSVTSTSYTLQLTDANRFINAANASPITITIPQQSSVAWEDNTQIEFVQGGAGAVTIAAGAGVTLRRNSSLAAASAGQWAVFGLKRIALNEWVVFGQMGAA